MISQILFLLVNTVDASLSVDSAIFTTLIYIWIYYNFDWILKAFRKQLVRDFQLVVRDEARTSRGSKI